MTTTREAQPAHVGRREQLEAAARVLINNCSSTLRTTYEEVIVRAEGPYLWNADGRRFIDNHLSFGATSVGHCDPRVNEAVHHAITTCDLTGIGPQVGEIELAASICETMPSADKVAFCSSGTEATLRAVHFARAATGRRTLVKFHGSYHGWHDQLGVGARFTPGIKPSESLYEPNGPGLVIEHVEILQWNDYEGVRRAFAERGSEFAALICEPYSHSYGCVPPAPGFLEELRELCTRYGAVLVFDEVKSGFRYHPGGYQAICGVVPDVTTFAKAIANGYALAGVACTDALIGEISPNAPGPPLSGTFNAPPYALAAAKVTTAVLADGGYERTAELGQCMRDGLRKIIDELRLPAHVTGLGGSWTIFFRPIEPTNFVEAIESDPRMLAAYLVGLREAGIFNSPVALASTDMRVCVATATEDVDHMLAASFDVLSELVERED